MGAKMVHSLVDKVYKSGRIWRLPRSVRRPTGAVRGRRELQEDTYQLQPVRQVQVPKTGKPGEFRNLSKDRLVRNGSNPIDNLSFPGIERKCEEPCYEISCEAKSTK